ncbi:hypothetical protein ACFXI6_02375 [Streptomyces mirabilis]|uniref:hypothetical protein n=1 Tax=Streptomyces mirabilis TaxID=68239 RepID=UPI00369579C1
MTAPQTRRPTPMVVHAHPDDEASRTGGTLACYAAAGAGRVEEYVRAHPPWTGDTRESDLFEGVRETS